MNIIKPIGTYKRYFSKANSDDCICKCSNCNATIDDDSVTYCPECKEEFIQASRGKRAVITFIDDFGNWHQVTFRR